MKAVIIFTVCRRYHELDLALTRLDELRGEFQEPPVVVVVWARPEVSHLWFFQQLLRAKRVDHLLTRLPIGGEGNGMATTVPESLNIRLGLDFVRQSYDVATHYAIVQAADVLPNPTHGYGYFDGLMHEGNAAVVLHWANGCVAHDVWHTNFFAVCLNPEYWPPVCDERGHDVLERVWGLNLADRRPPHIIKNHNSSNRRFTHNHLSEKLPPWPTQPQTGNHTLPLTIRGYKRWWRRVGDWLLRCIPFYRKNHRRADG